LLRVLLDLRELVALVAARDGLAGRCVLRDAAAEHRRREQQREGAGGSAAARGQPVAALRAFVGGGHALVSSCSSIGPDHVFRYVPASTPIRAHSSRNTASRSLRTSVWKRRKNGRCFQSKGSSAWPWRKASIAAKWTATSPARSRAPRKSAWSTGGGWK